MTIVDSHCHVGLHKYEPVESLLYHMVHSAVDRSVAIQYMGNSDNSYLVECVATHADKVAGVMVVEADDDGRRMRHWAEQGLVGIRLHANARVDGKDPLAQWRTAAELDLVVSACSSPALLLSAEFAEVLSEFPDLKIVIEHLGGATQDVDTEEFNRVLALASHENLTIKLPGFGEFCELPCPFAHVPALARMTLEAFGPRRMMWGSDYPPVSSREGYENSLSFPRDYFSDLSEEERGWIFGATALSVWKFR